METKIIINALRECKKPYTVMLDVSAEMIANRLEELETQNSLLRAENKFQKTFYAPQFEWISVEDRLPDANNLVLCWWESYDGEREHYGFATFQSNGVWYVSNEGMHKVTHWMSLPSPPKPKEPTFKDVFLEKFPKTPLGYNGALKLCARNVFPQINCSLSNGCAECWKQTYFEGEGENNA